jgi:uncharacterized membrane protein YcaP (DUF421 family)
VEASLHFDFARLDTLGDIIARTSIIYAFLLVGFRLSGKRQMGQMTVFDFVVILIVANGVQNAMLGQDTSLVGGLVSAGTLFSLNYVVNELRCRSRFVARWVGGVPTTLIESGTYLHRNMLLEHITEEEIMMALREHGIGEVSGVEKAVLETDGTISVLAVHKGSHKPPRKVRVIKHT